MIGLVLSHGQVLGQTAFRRSKLCKVKSMNDSSGTHPAAVRTDFQQEFPPNAGISQSAPRATLNKPKTINFQGASLWRSLPLSLAAPGRLLSSDTNLRLPPSGLRCSNTTLQLVLPDFCRRYTATCTSQPVPPSRLFVCTSWTPASDDWQQRARSTWASFKPSHPTPNPFWSSSSSSLIPSILKFAPLAGP